MRYMYLPAGIVEVIKEPATKGVEILTKRLLELQVELKGVCLHIDE